MAEQNSLLLLSDQLAELQKLVNDKDINNLMQDKEYMKLAERMAHVNRAANICSGIYFSMWMAQQNTEAKDGLQVQDKI